VSKNISFGQSKRRNLREKAKFDKFEEFLGPFQHELKLIGWYILEFDENILKVRTVDQTVIELDKKLIQNLAPLFLRSSNQRKVLTTMQNKLSSTIGNLKKLRKELNELKTKN
jgi:hypothetical protein